MKTLSALCLGTLLFLGACGKSTKKEALNTNPTNSPLPSVSPAATPTPSPTSGLKWSESKIAEQTEYCAEAGSEPYTFEQWKTFCRCAYEKAAARWTFQEFTNGFNEKYTELENDGTIINCLSKAGIY